MADLGLGGRLLRELEADVVTSLSTPSPEWVSGWGAMGANGA